MDKLINLSIRQSEINRINNELNNYFFEYIKNQVEPIFEESYINYTKSTKDNSNSNILFWKTAKPTENEWVEIMEPETVKEDRFEGAFALLKEIPKAKKSKMDKIKEGTQNDNINETEKEENKNFNRTSKSRKTTKRVIEIKEEKKMPVQTEIISNTTAIKPKNKKIQMIDFPSEDIPGYDQEFNYEIYDPPNIEKLRKEKEHEILKKEREIKMHNDLLKMAKKKEEEEKLKQNKKEKPLDTNKFTFDSNGTIIQFRQYKLDNLTKDFTFVKNSVKSESNKSNKKKKTSSIKAHQSTIPEEAVIKNPVDEERKEKEKSPIKILVERNQEKIIPSGSNFQIILPNIGVVIKENQNKKEGGREFNKYFNKYSIHDYETILNEYVPLQNKTKLNFQHEKLTLTPKHTNIQKKMSSSVDKSSAKKVMTSENNMNSNNKLINYNYTITENINNNNNPLLNTSDNLNNTNNIEIDNNNFSSAYLRSTIGINSYNKNSGNYNPLMTSSNIRSAFLNYGKDKTGANFNDSITMSKAGMTSLKMEIESLQDLRNDRTYYGPGNLKQKNILGSFMRNSRLTTNRQPVTNSLTNLNKNILTDGNWGNQIGGGKKDQNENIIYSRQIGRAHV